MVGGGARARRGGGTTGSRNMPSNTFHGPATTRWHQHRDQADAAPISSGFQPPLDATTRRTASAAPIASTTSGRNVERDAGEQPGDHPVATAVPCRRPGRRTRSTTARARRAPCQASADRPIGVMISTAVIHAAPTADDPAPCPRQGVDGEDDPDVLEQAERALGLERVAEDPVPEGEQRRASRARTGGGSRRWASCPAAPAGGRRA